MWHLLEKIYIDIAARLTTVDLILFILVVWMAVEKYLMRIRISKVLDAKDKEKIQLTKMAIENGEGYSRLANAVEMLVEKLKK